MLAARKVPACRAVEGSPDINTQQNPSSEAGADDNPQRHFKPAASKYVIHSMFRQSLQKRQKHRSEMYAGYADLNRAAHYGVVKGILQPVRRVSVLG